MSTAELDYSNTIIYKITCKDPNITDKYVGHTIDFVKRKYAHSNNAQSEKSPNYNLKLYKFIRDNGGWNNWKMEIVNFYNCNNLREAKEKEQEHYVELQATLNSIEPLKSKCDIKNEIPNDINISNFYCKDCNVACCKQDDWQRHLSSKKHRKNVSLDVSANSNVSNYSCNSCNYSCCGKYSWTKHIQTKKHKNNISDEKLKKIPKIPQNEYTCEKCSKVYNKYNSYWAHSKKCLGSKPETNVNLLINQLIADNKELRNFIIEQASEHKKETLDIINKMLENIKTVNNKIPDEQL